MNWAEQFGYLMLLGLPVACIAWTVTHEEIFREPREYCFKKSKSCKNIAGRKFFYLFTCEYCFSHYISLIFIFLTGFKLLSDGWQGYIIAFFALVWTANFYMTIFGLLRQNLKEEKAVAELKDQELKEKEK